MNIITQDLKKKKILIFLKKRLNSIYFLTKTHIVIIQKPKRQNVPIEHNIEHYSLLTPYLFGQKT